MADLITSSEAGVLAYGLMDELINTLIAKHVITESDRAAMFQSLHGRLQKDGRSGAKAAALALGQRLKK